MEMVFWLTKDEYVLCEIGTKREYSENMDGHKYGLEKRETYPCASIVRALINATSACGVIASPYRRRGSNNWGSAAGTWEDDGAKILERVWWTWGDPATTVIELLSES